MDSHALRGRSILVVEEEPHVSRQLIDHFRRAGATVFAAGKLRDALYLAEHPALSAAVVNLRMGCRQHHPCVPAALAPRHPLHVPHPLRRHRGVADVARRAGGEQARRQRGGGEYGCGADALRGPLPSFPPSEALSGNPVARSTFVGRIPADALRARGNDGRLGQPTSSSDLAVSSQPAGACGGWRAERPLPASGSRISDMP